MKFTTVTAAIVLSLSTLMTLPAFADASSKAAATTLLEGIGMEKALNDSVTNMLDVQIKQQPQMAPYKNVMQAYFAKYMSYNSLKGELIELYSQKFTASELQDLSKFYASPVGKKAMILMPELMSQGAQIGLRHMQEHQGELQTMLAAEEKRLKAKK